MIEIKLKKTHPDAVLPQANNPDTGTGDTGFDLVAVENTVIPAGKSNVVPVGLTLADITPGYWIRIEPRSGLGFKHSIQPHLGVIDNGYRGDLAVKLYNFGNTSEHRVKIGDKIAQLVVYELLQPIFSFTDTVTESTRGDKGFGSSDQEYNTVPFKHKKDVSPYKIKQTDDNWNYENVYHNGIEYIPNPMKVDQSDPDFIPDTPDSVSTSDGSTTYTAENV